MPDCAAPRHLGAPEPPPAVPGAYLCAPCQSRFRADLRHLPALERELLASLDPRRAGTVIGAAGAGLPYNDPAGECVSQIRHDLTTIAVWVLQQRDPATCPVPSTLALCAWLHGWSAWICARPWAPDAAGALASDCGRARALLDPMPCSIITIPADVNWCPRCGQAGCLVAVVWQNPADRRPSYVECGGCLHLWDAVQWLRLGRDIIRHVTAQAA